MDDIVALVRGRLKEKTTDQDRFEKRKIGKPATMLGLAADETRLGFALPPLLKRLYVELGNGGFGPGYGLIGMSGGIPDDLGCTAPESYLLMRSQDPSEPGWFWPEKLLPICHWGCAILSCVDCASPTFRMRIFDPNVIQSDDWSEAFFEEAESLERWIGEWAEGANLWDSAYGEEGFVRKILLEREGAESPHAVQLVLQTASRKKTDT